MTNNTFWLLSALAVGVPLGAAAQANPADPAAAAPALRYRSAFSDYKPWQDLPPGDWRAANEAVRPQRGASSGDAGTRAAAPAGSPAAPAAKPAPAAPAHARHPMHGGHE